MALSLRAVCPKSGLFQDKRSTCNTNVPPPSWRLQSPLEAGDTSVPPPSWRLPEPAGSGRYIRTAAILAAPKARWKRAAQPYRRHPGGFQSPLEAGDTSVRRHLGGFKARWKRAIQNGRSLRINAHPASWSRCRIPREWGFPWGWPISSFLR